MAFRGKGMPTAIILVLVALGSVLFHLLSPWWWTPIASNWGYIDDTINLTFWITGVVFTAIILFMAYCVFRFRHQPGRRAVYEPENKKLEWWLTIVTAVGVGARLAPGLFGWSKLITVPPGTSEIQYVSSDNPLGLNPNDPDATDDVVIEADDLHPPAGKPVKLLQRSID